MVAPLLVASRISINPKNQRLRQRSTTADMAATLVSRSAGLQLLMKPAKAEVLLYIQSVDELLQNALLPCMIAMVGLMTSQKLKAWSHEGCCCVRGRAVEAGNFAYPVLWSSILTGASEQPL